MKKLVMSPVYTIGNKIKNKEISKEYIADYYWCDIKWGGFPNGVLPFGLNEVFALCIFYKEAIGKKATITVINRTNGNEVETITFKILKTKMKIKIDQEKMSKSCDGNAISFFVLRINVDREKFYPDPQWQNQNLKIHFVTLVPKIMKELGWVLAAKAQTEWFTEKGTNFPWEARPKIGYYTLGGLMHFERFKKFYDEHLNDWKSEKSISLLKERILNMQKDKIIEFPTAINPIQEFGTFSEEVVDKIIKPEELAGKTVTEKMPMFEKYYMQNVPYQESKWTSLDDFFGAVANCNLRFVAKGFLYYKNGKIEVEIKKIATYLKDGFDFVDSSKNWSQPLGFWSYTNKKVYKIGTDGDISNSNYRDYRYETGMGHDCYKYSNLYIQNVNHPKFVLK